MRLYLVAPVIAENDDREATDARFRACSGRIAELISSHVWGDPALFAMRHIGEASVAPVQPNAFYGDAETVEVSDRATLKKILAECGDPNSGKWMLIRSLVTCRSVFYGHDGQAFVCLPTGSPPILSPDETMIRVEDCSHLLIETDLMDGLVHD
jgi:hypothetical protein